MSRSSPIKVVMFPWLGYGHIMPYLELAKKLTSSPHGDFKVYLCSTLAALGCIEHKITDNMSQSISLVPILLPASPDLPRKLQTTNGLPPALMEDLKSALQSDVAKARFSDILSDHKPDLVIFDFLMPWVPKLVKSMNIPAVQFITSSCSSISIMCHYFMNPKGDVEFPFPEIRFRDYDESHAVGNILACANNPKSREMVFTGIEESCGVVLVKGLVGIEQKYADYASELLGKKIVVVGPLVQEADVDENKDDRDVLAWLDGKEPKSTVFVSFGSEYFLTKEEFDAVAHGLELSGVNFIWVVRFPKQACPNRVNGRMKTNLPEGFVERVGERGWVLDGWAPQAKILSHASTGGFVSHCGWNSVLESMSLGVPLIAMPMHLDQPTNARLVENVGVGVEVLRDGERRIRGEALAEAIRRVVVEAGGESVRTTAAGMKEKLGSNGGGEMDEVVKAIVVICNKRKNGVCNKNGKNGVCNKNGRNGVCNKNGRNGVCNENGRNGVVVHE